MLRCSPCAGRHRLADHLRKTPNNAEAHMPVIPGTRRTTHQSSVGTKRVYLSLGSNLGDSRTLIRNGLKMLSGAGVKVLRVSSLYRTEPVDLPSQPWFINCAAEVETRLSPRGLLRLLKSTERALGRRRGTPKGPRPIDIDILLYENVVVSSRALTIPHARMKERRFVLVPLREIAPRVLHPATRKTIFAMLRETADVSKVVKLKKK